MGMQEPRMLHRSYGTVWVCMYGVPGFWLSGIIMYKSKKLHEIYPDKILQNE